MFSLQIFVIRLCQLNKKSEESKLFKMISRLIFATAFIGVLTASSFACLFCKDFFANNEQWRIVSGNECWNPQMHYFFNCLGYIQCEKLSDGQYNASLKLCPQTSKTYLSGFDPEKGGCSEDYKCMSFNEAEANEPVRNVPQRECMDKKRIHESNCKMYYNCGASTEYGKVQATLQSCEKELGKPNVRFNPILMWCEEGEYPRTWECSKNTLKLN